MQNRITSDNNDDSSDEDRGASISESEESEESGYYSIPCPDELQHLDKIIGDMTDNLCTRLQKQAKAGNIAEMKPLFRAFIYMLKEIYENIPDCE